MSLPPLTYTFLSDYRNCPRKAHHRFVLKDLPAGGPPTEAMQTGIDVHAAIEARLKGKTPVGPYEPIVGQVRPPKGGRMEVEMKLAIAKSGRWTDFFSKDAWMRGKADVVIINEARDLAFLVDWKTGRRREDPFELECQALLLKGNVPTLRRIYGTYIWLKDEKPGEAHDVSDTKSARKLIDEDEARMLAGEWDPTPNPLCGFCPVKSCEFNRS